MKLTSENLDGMDCRPPTGRDTGIVLSEEIQQRLDKAVQRRLASKRGPPAVAKRLTAE